MENEIEFAVVAIPRCRLCARDEAWRETLDPIAALVDAYDFPCFSCRRIEARFERNRTTQSGKLLPMYVALYGIDRLYGGPEEGGWYFDWITLKEVRRAFTWQDALAHWRELREENPKPRHDRFSVIGGTDPVIRVFRTMEHVHRLESKDRPHYE